MRVFDERERLPGQSAIERTRQSSEQPSLYRVHLTDDDDCLYVTALTDIDAGRYLAMEGIIVSRADKVPPERLVRIEVHDSEAVIMPAYQWVNYGIGLASLMYCRHHYPKG